MKDHEILNALIEARYDMSSANTETNYYNGQYYYWTDFKDYKTLNNLW